jgi:8-oxo-dGTP pyrophosphatase MutT (NUDIX family)
MKQQIHFAQKGLVLDKTKSKILVIKYSDAKYMASKLKNKLGLPGGKIEFEEQPDQSFINEVKEETGITIKPLLPFYTWTWIYQKENTQIQIVAIARLAHYQSGKLTIAEDQIESTIESSQWLNLKEIKLADFIIDEQPVIKKFLQYQRQNPFLL